MVGKWKGKDVRIQRLRKRNRNKKKMFSSDWESLFTWCDVTQGMRLWWGPNENGGEQNSYYRASSPYRVRPGGVTLTDSCWIYWGVAFLFPLFWELSGKTIRTCLRLCPSISLQKNDCKRWLNATEIYSLVCVEGAEIYKEDAIGATPPLEALGASPSLPLPAPADLLSASPVSVSMFTWSSSLCASEIQISLCLLLLQRILAIGFRFP